MSKALAEVAKRLSISENELQNVVINTVMPNGGRSVTEAQFTSFIAVANEYKLNPLTKEIYAFPTQGGGIQPIVAIDGWLKIINNHPEFNGMTFKDDRDDSGNLIAITCQIYKKGIEHPVEVTEYMSECLRNTSTWKQWPARMLRHKAAIQAGRYAFGLSGIVDPDEAERFQDAQQVAPQEAHQERDITPVMYSDEQFQTNVGAWQEMIRSGKKTAEELIYFLAKKNINLTESQINTLETTEVTTDETA